MRQSNEGQTSSKAGNANNTEQGNFQDQQGVASGGKDGGSRDNGHGQSGSVTQSQSASNSNSTDQSAESSASNEQSNVNEPFSEDSS